MGFTTEDESEDIARFRMDELIHRILEETESDSYTVYISGGRKETFRAKLYPEYKANRKQPKPLHYEFLKKYLIEAWNAVVAVDEEADDLLGINQTDDTIIVSIDKDMLTIPGMHYNFVKKQFISVDPDEALLWFYKQILQGDNADNIKGITGCGPKTADKILDPYFGEDEVTIFEVVQEAYRQWLQKEWADREWGDFEEKQMNNLILLAGILLKIRTIKDESLWSFPEGLVLKPEVVPVLS